MSDAGGAHEPEFMHMVGTASGYGLIFTPKLMTADCPGAKVPGLARIGPTAPSAGAEMLPAVVAAATVAVYTVLAGVASLTTTEVTLAMPTLVAVIW